MAKLTDAARAPSILITGASTGIGWHCATELAGRGWVVVATARQPDDLACLEAAGCRPLPLELTDRAAVERAGQDAIALAGGQLDALFNNAAYGQPRAVEDLPVEHLRRQFEVNVFAWHALTRSVLPTMLERGSGRIVQCSSVLGLVSPPFRGAYNASKFAIEALSDAMRHELAGTGVHVSLIEPGPIESRFVDGALAALRDNIDIEDSRHGEKYRARLAQLEAGGTDRFKLPPDAVLAKLRHAIESSRPKRRYYVTWPTYFAAYGRRFLPEPVWDRIVAAS